MAHNRIITSLYNDSLKIAKVVKSSQYGEFCETAHCSPDDDPNAWDGQKIAERRCDIQIQKAKAKDYQSRLKGMKHLQAILHDKFNDNKDYYTIGMVEVLDELDHQVKIMERQTKNQIAFSNNLKNGFNDYVNFLQTTRAKVRARAEALKNAKNKE